MSLIINFMLLLIGYTFLDKRTTVYTIIAVSSHSLFLLLTESWNVPSGGIVLNAIVGGIVGGIGLGLIIRFGGTLAGTTILARIANKHAGWNISYTLLLFDIVVACSSYFVIGFYSLLLTIIMLFATAKVMDRIIGRGAAPKVNPQEV